MLKILQILMIISYNWQILDRPLQKQQCLSSILPIPKPSNTQLVLNNNQSLNSTIQPSLLKSPMFSFIFSYYVQQPKFNQPQIHLFPQIILFQNKVQVSLLQEKKQKNYIYQLLKIQNCQCFQTLLTLMIKIKYIQGPTQTRIQTIQKLIDLVGKRKINSHAFQVYSIIKKQLTIQQPFCCQYHYDPKGFIWMKFFRNQDSIHKVSVAKIQLLPWLSNNQVMSSHICEAFTPCQFTLRPKQCFALMFSFPINLQKSVELPYATYYRVEPLTQIFKVIKFIKIIIQQ